MNVLPFILVGSAVGIASWFLVAQWIRFSLRARIIDQPTHRSSHTVATPRGGGTGIVVACGAGLLLAWATGAGGEATTVGALVATAVLIAALSFVDDVRSLPSLLRLVLHVGAASGAVFVLGPFREVALPFLGVAVLPSAIATAVTVLWIVGLTNVYNFMDGIDGIAGTQGLVSGFAWAVFGWTAGSSFIVWLGVILAAACAGFLVHNWSPAKVFMGDVGSAFLGFTFALAPLLAIEAGGAEVGAVPVFAVLSFWPFLADGAFTLVRRMKNRENVLQAHRSHLYQRLTIVGWKHAPVTRLYLAWAATGAGLGFLFLWFPGDFARATVLAAALVSLVAVCLLVKDRELAQGRRTRGG